VICVRGRFDLSFLWALPGFRPSFVLRSVPHRLGMGQFPNQRVYVTPFPSKSSVSRHFLFCDLPEEFFCFDSLNWNKKHPLDRIPFMNRCGLVSFTRKGLVFSNCEKEPTIKRFAGNVERS
jgi:hypothetical protein